MSELSLSRLLHLSVSAIKPEREKPPPVPESYFFEKVDGKLMYVIPDGHVLAEEVKQQMIDNLQNLLGQIQVKLSNKTKP